MFFDIVLVAALVIFGIGLIYKISSWFRLRIGISARNLSAFQRFLNAVKGIIGVIFRAHPHTHQGPCARCSFSATDPERRSPPLADAYADLLGVYAACADACP